MPRRTHHIERHAVDRIGWLRAAVLGANDGIVSTASLIVGVAAAHGDGNSIFVAGAAGLVAGAMSMAAGEYVSVSSQRDAETADLAREARELAEMPEHERQELTQIYIDRGLDPALARQVADQLTAHDALGAHARDELGISKTTEARPIQAALASAASFSVGAALPLAVAFLAPLAQVSLWVGAACVLALALLGFLGARAGGAGPLKPVIRVVFWGIIAMLVTAGIGSIFGAVV
jgi:vacuolar iron transporter family protein